MDHPIRLVVTDDLHRSRLTVFFRLLLAIPHLFWVGLWSTVAFVIVVINWFATLFKGRSPQALHDFLAGHLRYTTHVLAYLLLAANPFPAFFMGSVGAYPVDVEFDPPASQSRAKTGFRLVLLLPTLLIAMALLGCAFAAAFLAWFATLVRGRSPRGLRDLTAWALGYYGQMRGYRALLTDRYPHSAPQPFLEGLEAPAVDERLPRLVNDDDLRRSRVTVLFRLPLAFPHFVWWYGWFYLAYLAWLLNWFAALALGRSPRPLARFLAAFIRYSVHLLSFLYLVGNPFPGFVGKPGSYPVDVRLDPFQRQGRWLTLGRLPFAIGFALVLPALLLWGGISDDLLFAVAVLGSLAPLVLPALLLWAGISEPLLAVAVLGWFASLVRGRMPAGLQSAGAYALGYQAQLYAYWWLLTDRYPHASPLAVFETPAPAPALD